MSEPDDVDDEALTVPLLALPAFKAQIPDHLLEGMSKRDYHTLVTMHIIAQQVDWLCHNLIDQNAHLRRIERDHIRLRRWKDILSSKWSVVAFILLLLAPLVVSKLVERVLVP